jgi:hypothetical protein
MMIVQGIKVGNLLITLRAYQNMAFIHFFNQKACVLALLCIFIGSMSFAQKKKKLSTIGQGTLYINFGYNRAAYTPTNFQFTADDYNFNLDKVKGSDSPSGYPVYEFLNKENIQNPDFNFQIGYYIRPKWGIGLGVDRLNYFTDSDQRVFLTGAFNAGENEFWSGQFENEEVQLNRSNLYYRQLAGMNYLRASVLFSHEIFQSNQEYLSINLNTSLSGGVIISNSQFTYNGLSNTPVTSLSGFGFSSHIGVRADFFQRIFILASFSGGYLNQGSVKLSHSGDAFAKHSMMYFSPEISLGFLVFVRPTNNCGTCPNW